MGLRVEVGVRVRVRVRVRGWGLGLGVRVRCYGIANPRGLKPAGMRATNTWSVRVRFRVTCTKTPRGAWGSPLRGLGACTGT